MVGIYNEWLVVLSFVVAVVATFAALDLAVQVSAAQHRAARWLWTIGGAVTAGAGIWSMHFIGMLAFALPIPVSYDISTTGLSLLLPIVVSGFGLQQARRAEMSRSRTLLSGAIIGLGIAAMHYTGMAAMKMQPPIVYRPILVGLSVLIALAGSVVGVWSSFRLRMETLSSAVVKKLGSALMAGIAIVGLHYTGMAAANFAPDSVCTARAQNIDAFALALAVAGFALSFQLITLIISAFHAYRAEQASKHAASLQDANVALDQTRHQLAARVAERTAELDQAHGQLVELQESERRQLSRELHDRVGQNLTALGLNLDALRSQFSGDDRAGMRARIEDSIALVEATADAIENVMAELHPPMLDDHGLLPALQWYAKQFSERTGIGVTVLGGYPEPRVGPQIEIVLFRIAQEALNNVAKHARAAHVEIALDRSESELVLSVLDDGTGFDLAVPSGAGHGMAMMRERAHSIGGRIEINALPGEGTQVVIRVGLRA